MPGSPALTSRRVLHVLASDERRGAEVFACALASALEPLGWSSSTVALRRSGSPATVAATVIGDGLSPGTLWALRRAALEHDVVVAHGSTSLPACAVACLGAAPFVYRSIGDPSYWSSRRIKRFQTTLLLNRTRTVVALFPAAADLLLRRGVRRPVTVIPNAVPAAGIPPSTRDRRRDARAALGLPPEASVVLALGALSPEKRPHVVVELAERRPDLTVLVVGDGPLGPELARRSRSIPNVVIHGPTRDPVRFLHAADVLALPSATEGIPAAAIEAGLAGLAVVATDVGGLSSVVDHGVTGLLVPTGDDAAFEAAVDEALGVRDSLGQAARARCLEHFDLGPVARRWAEVIADAASPTTGT